MLTIVDGCGIVEAVGHDVTLFKVGDKVAPVFPQGHHYVSDRALTTRLGSWSLGAVDMMTPLKPR